VRPTDLALTVTPSKLACVLDPVLALGYAHGPTLALRLARVFETWLTRSFWQVIDASDLLPNLLGAECEHAAASRMPLDTTALAAWMTLRDTTDAGSWRLRWMGDCVAESQMHDGSAADLVERYEFFVGALGARAHPAGAYAPTWANGLDPVMSAFDALALSATLDGAPVLSVVDAPAAPPAIVRAIERARVPMTVLEPMPQESLFAAERELVRDALVTVGLASIATTLPPLAVVHVLVGADAGEVPEAEDGVALFEPWERARAWWYLV
jgi:hypothetical protein